MICLTGDLHHMSLKTGNQAHCDITEMQTAIRFLSLLEKYEVKATFFITGKSFNEEWEDVKEITSHSLVEVGGHNFDAFEHEFLHRVWNKFTKNYNGPRCIQKRDALKTIDVIEQKIGKKINIWRNHMYMHGANTEDVLHECGIKICSDGVKKDSNYPVKYQNGIMNFPINIIPDHEHLIHAERTPQWIEQWQKRYNWSDDFGKDSYYIDEWANMVLEQLKHRESKGLVSNMIIHPITMYLCDKFASIEKILEYISTRQNVHMSSFIKE